MGALWKDMLAAVFLGMVLPGIVLNGAVMLQRDQPAEELQIAVPVETETSDKNFRIMLRKSDTEMVALDMETYLVRVLLGEMPTTFEDEALKAQSVAARTYARKAVETGGKHGDGSVCNLSGCCQAYLEPEPYLNQGGTEAGIEKMRNAVRETAGQCLEYDGELIEATYFSCSGGRTEEAVAVWGSEYPYLQAVDSPGEENARWYTDEITFTTEAFFAALDLEVPEENQQWLGRITYTNGGGVETIVIGGRLFTGTRLRSLLGLRSTAFTIEIKEDRICVTTKGYGHRVGMSQYGAEAMAAAGSDYRKILAHYYPGTELVTLDP